MVALLLADAAHLASADVAADAPSPTTSPAAVVIQAPPGSTNPPQAAQVAVASAAATPASRFDDDQVRRGAAIASPAGPAKTGGFDHGYELPRVLGALAAVIGLIFLLRWFGKRFFALPTARRSTRVVQVLSRSVLSPKQQLVLLRVGQRVLVTADNGSQLSPLSEITDPDEVASLIGQLQSERDTGAFGISSARAFNSMFGRLKKSTGMGGADEDASGGIDDGLADEGDEHVVGHEDYSASTSGDGSTGNDNIVAATRHELNGLMEKVRLVSDQFGRT